MTYSTMLKNKKPVKTISVAQYARNIGVSPQVVYQRIATGKLLLDKDWITERQERFLKRIIVKSSKKSKK